jgi:hypothetical protein
MSERKKSGLLSGVVALTILISLSGFCAFIYYSGLKTNNIPMSSKSQDVSSSNTNYSDYDRYPEKRLETISRKNKSLNKTSIPQSKRLNAQNESLNNELDLDIYDCPAPVKFLGEINGSSSFACSYGQDNQKIIWADTPAMKTYLIAKSKNTVKK